MTAGADLMLARGHLDRGGGRSPMQAALAPCYLAGMATAYPLPAGPVAAALATAFVQGLAPERRAALEEDLREMAREAPSLAQLQEWVDERIHQEQRADEVDSLTPEELAELERRAADADAHPERLIPLEAFLAARGMG